MKRFQFTPKVANNPLVAKEPEEFPDELADPIEKEIVSVHKAELARYAMCGRTV